MPQFGIVAFLCNLPSSHVPQFSAWLPLYAPEDRTPENRKPKDRTLAHCSLNETMEGFRRGLQSSERSFFDRDRCQRAPR
jgi:hypothetical protein